MGFALWNFGFVLAGTFFLVCAAAARMEHRQMIEAGRLLLTLPGPPKQADFQLSGSFLLFMWLLLKLFLADDWDPLLSRAQGLPRFWSLLSAVFWTAASTGAVSILLADGKPASGLYQHGLLLRGVLIPWSEITTFSWSKIPFRTPRFYLLVKTPTEVKHCRVPVSGRERVDRLMRQYVPAAQTPQCEAGPDESLDEGA